MNSMFRISYRKMAPAGDDGGAGGGGDDGAAAAAAAEAAAAEAAALAAANGGKPTAAEAALLKEVMDKKAKLKDLEKALGDTKNLLAQFEGLDPAAVKAAVQAQKDLELKGLEKKGEWETIKKQMVEQHTTELTTLQKAIKDVQDQLSGRDSTIDQLTIGSSFSGSSYISEVLAISPRAARIEFGSHFSRDAEGNVIGYDKPTGAAGRAPLVDANGNPLAFDVALQKLVDSLPNADELKKSKIGNGGDGGSNSKKKNEEQDPGTGASRINAALAAGALKPFKILK